MTSELAEVERLRAEMTALRAAFLSRSDERDKAERLIQEAFRAGAAWGLAQGDSIGYTRAHVEMETAWHAAAGPVARGGPSFTELETRRWTVRGESRT
jgi:hypothetical protein